MNVPDKIELIRALQEIQRIVYTPTSATAFKRAGDHYQADFDNIRKIIKQTIG